MKKKTSPANLLALHGQPTTAIMGTNRIQTAVKKLQHHQLKSTSTFFCTVSCEAAQEGCSFSAPRDHVSGNKPRLRTSVCSQSCHFMEVLSNYITIVLGKCESGVHMLVHHCSSILGL